MDTVTDMDMHRAKAAVRCLNETNRDASVVYRIARVEVDADPPISLVVDVKASELPGDRLPAPPDPGPSPDDVYVPPEQRGAFVTKEAPVAPIHDEVKAARVAATNAALEEIGEHLFPNEGFEEARCINCGVTLADADKRRRCLS